MKEKTTLLDIYEAAGAKTNEDRSMVTMDSNQLRPFKIELLVYPHTITTMGGYGPDLIRFGVVLDDEHSYESTYMGTYVHNHEFEVELELPVSQVKIVKE